MLAQAKVFVLKHATFFEKWFLLKKASGNVIDIEKFNEPQIDIVLEPKLVAEALDAQTEAHAMQMLQISSSIRLIPKKYGFLLKMDAMLVDDKPVGKGKQYVILILISGRKPQNLKWNPLTSIKCRL